LPSLTASSFPAAWNDPTHCAAIDAWSTGASGACGTRNSFERAAIALDKIAGNKISAKTIRCVAEDVDGELSTQRKRTFDQEIEKTPFPAPPALSIIECDGGQLAVELALAMIGCLFL